MRREKVGPVSRRKTWWVLVDSCWICRRHEPVHPGRLTYQQRRWIERWNAACDRDVLLPPPAPAQTWI